jgi:formylmethanofuran dehydrogenase subunit E
MDEDLRKAIEFHGHLCPGRAIGYRVAKYIKGHHPRSEDEEMVAIVENNSCSVDAVQQMLGCTFGKGNMIYKDYGKQVFTFYIRGEGKALRIYFKGDISGRMDGMRSRYFKGGLTDEERDEFEELRELVTRYLIDANDEEILSVREVDIPAPEKARIYPSLKCQECGEGFMEICGRTANGKVLCKDCFDRLMRL